MRLGDILVNAGIITREQLERALSEQRRLGGRLGDVITRLFHVPDTAIVLALSEQMNLPVVPEAQLRPNPVLAQRFNAQRAWELFALPLSETADAVVVAVHDPLNAEIPAWVKSVTGKEAKPVLAQRSALERALTATYGDRDELAGLRRQVALLREENERLSTELQIAREKIAQIRRLLSD